MTSGPEHEALRQTLQAIEERLLDPALRHDPDGLRALLAEGFVEFGASGQAFDREAIIAALMSESAPPGRRVEAFRLRAERGGMALTTCRVESPAGVTLRSSTWLRSPEGAWQMVFHQGTVVPPRDEGTS